MDDDNSSSVKFMNPNHTAARPTEGQLKWALFNHKRVAAKVQEYVERLYMCPESIDDVPVYLFPNHSRQSIDHDEYAGNLLAAEESTIRISEGRRVLLYFSNLEYENRKSYVSVNGFRYHRSTSDDESDQSTNSDEWVSGKFRMNVQTMPSNNNTCMPSTGRRKKFRRRRKKFQPRCSDPERVRRFKEAFQVALHSLELAAASQNDRQPASLSEPDMAVAASSPNMQNRKWKRPENNDEFSYPTEAYTVYGCSTVPKRQPSVHNPTLTPGKAPLDRGATWLNLWHASVTKKVDGRTGPMNTTVPTNTTHEDRYCTGNSYRSTLTPALRQHVADVAREIFSGERHGSGHSPIKDTTNSASPLQPNLETLERDINSFVDQFEDHLMNGCGSMDDDDDDDSVMSSPRKENFDVAVSMIGRPIMEGSGTVSSIVPVVTYDSDESKHHMAWNESRISKNLDETFTLQELDSSFQCWNVTGTPTGISSPLMTKKVVGQIDTVNIVYTDHLKHTGDPDAPDFISPSNHVTDVCAIDPILDLSPMNLKQYVRCLPDPTDIINLIAASSSQIQTSVTDNDVDETEEENTIESVLPVIRMDVVPITSNTNAVSSSQQQATLPQQQHDDSTQRFSVTQCAKQNDMDPTKSNPVWPLLPCDTQYYHYDTSTTSTGCGLYTERGSHYDVTWERRLRL